MWLLENAVRAYDWGSPTEIPRLLGLLPTGGPQAELWLGAHPGQPSSLVTADGPRPLDAEVAARPGELLGPAVRARFGDRLPFLLKVLAAERPLSLQVHPSESQAQEGYDAEDAAGVPLDAPHRNYKDRHHKPELVYALTPFDALCGFRSPASVLEVLEGLDAPGLDVVRTLLSTGGESAALRGSFEHLLTAVTEQMVGGVVATCAQRLARGSVHSVQDATVLELARTCPGDPGVVVSLLLNRVTLRPGEALYLPAGNVHAYLRGTAVEIMASSDNVLRGGLTAKHVDVPELLRVVRFEPADVPYASPDPDGDVLTWSPGPEEFSLWLVSAGGTETVTRASGPRIALCLHGSVTVRAGGEELVLHRGASALVADADGPLGVDGVGTVAIATVRM